jgi:hypothetical protein
MHLFAWVHHSHLTNGSHLFGTYETFLVRNITFKIFIFYIGYRIINLSAYMHAKRVILYLFEGVESALF